MTRAIPAKTIPKTNIKAVNLLKSNNHKKAGSSQAGTDTGAQIATGDQRVSFEDRMFLAEVAYSKNFKKAKELRSPGGGVAGGAKQKIDYSTGIGSAKGPEAVATETKSDDWDDTNTKSPEKIDPKDLSDK